MRIHTLLLSVAFSGLVFVSGCGPKPAPEKTNAALIVKESADLNGWFEARYEDELARSPLLQTYYGIKDQQDKLDDTSKLAADENAALKTAWLKDMRKNFDIDRLDAQAKLSYRLFEYQAENDAANHGFADQTYVFDHMSGPHSNLPSFLINFHPVDNVTDLNAYISRLEQVENYLGEYAKQAESQFANGVELPKFAYPKLVAASQNVITGAPFSEGEDSPLWADFKAKLDKLDPEDGYSDEMRETLIASATSAMFDSVKPAYENLIEMFERHGAMASYDDGAWKLPRGEAYYQRRLKHYTTTDLSADEIHQIGLREVARIQDEMRVIMRQVGFDGTLKEFFTHLRTDPKFTFPNDDAGRDAYITQATAMIDEMKGQLDGLFITKPKADVVVKRVEPFREASAFGAFYNSPALDGSRPGTYYINLKDMNELPIYQMQALAYHEGIPGHHMQIAIAQELQGLPKFRTLGGFTAYVEGWALYSETVPKELGLYTDPYQDFGRLSMEIFRAARLVLDTGIHAKKWTRDEAVTYMLNNTANSEGDIRAEVDRYIVWPGQATAYMIGKLKIEELRANAEEALGDKFDIRAFHDVVLANGAVPLTVLEELVDAWVSETASKTH